MNRDAEVQVCDAMMLNRKDKTQFIILSLKKIN